MVKSAVLFRTEGGECAHTLRELAFSFSLIVVLVSTRVKHRDDELIVTLVLDLKAL